MPKPLKLARKRAIRDENEAAHASVQRIIQIGGSEPAPDFDAQFRAHMATLGSKGGKASGAKRMENLSDEKRREIASRAARTRWEAVAKRKAAKKR